METGDDRTVVWEFNPGDAQGTDVILGVTAPGRTLPGMYEMKLPWFPEMLWNERLAFDRGLEVGKQLWGALPEPVTGDMKARLDAAKPSSPVGLELQFGSARAGDLPWELLADDDGPLALRPVYRIRRTIPTRVAALPLTVRLPLRVLVVFTNPGDQNVLNRRDELDTVAGATWSAPAMSGRSSKRHPSPRSGRDSGGSLTSSTTIGHGGLNQGQGNLILQDERQMTVWLTPAQAAGMLPPTTRLICLSTCATRPNYQVRGLLRMAHAPASVALRRPSPPSFNSTRPPRRCSGPPSTRCC